MVSDGAGKVNEVFISPLDRLCALVYLHWSVVLEVHADVGESGEEATDRAIERLRKGLSRLTTEVPYLKGRVTRPAAAKGQASPTTRLVLSWSPDTDPDIVFSEKVMVDKPLPSLETMKKENAPAHFFPTNIITLPLFVDVSTTCPVFEAKYIRIDGGLVVNMCVHHGIMDGGGQAVLTDMWAAFTRLNIGPKDDITGIVLGPRLKQLPDPDEPLTRTATLLKGASSSLTEQRELSQTELDKLIDRYSKDHAFGHDLMALLSIAAAGPKCGSSIARFSVTKLERAKEALSAAGFKCTTNTLLHAIMWSCITRVRLSRRNSRPPTDESRFSMSVDGRGRMGPAIRDKGPYLGNVVLISAADLQLDTLEEAGTRTIFRDSQECLDQAALLALAPIVTAISQQVERVTGDGHIRGLLSTLVHKSIQDMDVGPGWLSPHRINFMSSSWANLPLYDCDFGAGLGTPIFVRYPYAEYNDGNAVVLPRKRGSGDETIEVYIMLALDDLQALVVDPVWKSWQS
ncbi:trichothecene c-8 acyl transferase [Colletotrichum incanum]|uniref:Trichothecene c-8 acyl transferase n=1 Tax=Colletotrichum incanum TaxID=1573173 RepID=A0A162NNL2_COLIC|nr:trichothecene c-8 acyl transferase [Colletotrichum incanum]